MRWFIAFIISNLRYKKSWKKYQQIGGSPLVSSMNKISNLLHDELGKEYKVSTCYSYSSPSIKQVVHEFVQLGISNITIVPMYPQASFSTTGSIKNEIHRLQIKNKHVRFTIVEDYYAYCDYISWWTMLIRKCFEENNMQNPTLLFSAHTIPQNDVNKGDYYVQKIYETAFLISQKLECDYKVGFQSKLGHIKWVEPDTKSMLEQLVKEQPTSILIVPISFVTENLETKYDIDIELIPYIQNELNFQAVSRVHIPSNHILLIQTLKNLIQHE
jgi:ferrochelatase